MAELQIPLDIECLTVITQEEDKKGNNTSTVESKMPQTACQRGGEAATKRLFSRSSWCGSQAR